MNIIFLTMARITGIESRGIYQDLMRKFRDEGHTVYIVTPSERRLRESTRLVNLNDNDNLDLNGKGVGGVHFLRVKTLNLQKTNAIEKGVGQVLVESQYKAAIKKYLSDVKFDLVLYSTPPIAFPKVIAYLKRKNPQAMTYLLLKDIFPQNAVDLGMMSKTGVKGVLYKFFRKKEKKLYALSDYIGCMSPANVAYLLKHNPEIARERVEVAPNSIELTSSESPDPAEKDAVRAKCGLPIDKPVFIYGGNLGKPQGIPFLIKCLEANMNRRDSHFVIIGTGTELPKLKQWHSAERPRNVTVMDGLPKEEYDHLVRACDVGLIFLDHRFTIPNYPSRLLSYLENKMPVLCATDPNTDMGRIAEENGFGLWCESNSVQAFTSKLDQLIHSDRKEMGEKGYAFLEANYMVENTYDAIVAHLNRLKTIDE